MSYSIYSYNLNWPVSPCSFRPPSPLGTIKIEMPNCATAHNNCDFCKLNTLMYQYYLEGYRNLIRNNCQREDLIELQKLTKEISQLKSGIKKPVEDKKPESVTNDKKSLISRCISCCCAKRGVESYDISEVNSVEKDGEVLSKLCQISEKLSVINHNVKSNMKYLKKSSGNTTRENASIVYKKSRDNKQYSDISVKFRNYASTENNGRSSSDYSRNKDDQEIAPGRRKLSQNGEKKYCTCKRQKSNMADRKSARRSGDFGETRRSITKENVDGKNVKKMCQCKHRRSSRLSKSDDGIPGKSSRDRYVQTSRYTTDESSRNELPVVDVMSTVKLKSSRYIPMPPKTKYLCEYPKCPQKKRKE